MRDPSTTLASIEIIGRTVLIRFVSKSLGPRWPLTDTGRGYVSTPEGFWDRYDKRWIVSDTSRRVFEYTAGFWKQVDELCESGHSRFVLDCGETIDPLLERDAIHRTLVRVRQVDGWMGVVAPTRIEDSPLFTLQEEHYPIFDNLEDALAAAELQW